MYVRDRAPPGDPEAVIRAIDEFSAAYPMYKIGPQKGRILDELVRVAQPALVVELGSFVGYSAVSERRAGNMAVQGQLHARTIETAETLLS